MRAIVVLYFLIGILLLGLGLLFTGPCPQPNGDLVGDAVFVLTWPVGLYAEVYRGAKSAQQWVHQQACEAGGPLGKKPPPAPAPPLPPR
jgi:hypothetical protein